MNSNSNVTDTMTTTVYFSARIWWYPSNQVPLSERNRMFCMVVHGTTLRIFDVHYIISSVNWIQADKMLTSRSDPKTQKRSRKKGRTISLFCASLHSKLTLIPKSMGSAANWTALPPSVPLIYHLIEMIQ